MIDYGKEVGDALVKVLPTYFELFSDGPVEKPCITYAEYANRDVAAGDTVGYSELQFMVKLWTDTAVDTAAYMLQIDDQMRRLGFRRSSAGELRADGQIC